MKKVIGVMFLAWLVMFTLAGCHENKNKKTSETIVTVKEQKHSQTLFYSGVIAPLSKIVMTIPVEGVVTEMHFHYGDTVHKGQLLFVINSAKYRTDFKTALTSYLKAKESYETSRNQLQEAKFLQKNGLISGDDYKSKQSGYYSNALLLAQAHNNLWQLQKLSKMMTRDVYSLTIKDVNVVKKLLDDRANAASHIFIYSKYDGIALEPIKSAGANSDGSSETIEKGSHIKQDDVLMDIGNLKGFTVNVSVGEVDINSIHVGQVAVVTGVAFPGITLQGRVSTVSNQAKMDVSGLPSFPIMVMIPKISTKVRETIHIGMTAKVEIKTQEKMQMLVPIKAVTQDNNVNTVMKVNAATNKPEKTQVKVGSTTLDSIVIVSGLKAGDKIVVPD